MGGYVGENMAALYERLRDAPMLWDEIEKACGGYQVAYHMMGALVEAEVAVQDEHGRWSARPWGDLYVRARAVVQDWLWYRTCQALTRQGLPLPQRRGRARRSLPPTRRPATVRSAPLGRQPLPAARRHMPHPPGGVRRDPGRRGRGGHLQAMAARYGSVCALCRDRIEHAQPIVRIAPPGGWVPADCGYRGTSVGATSGDATGTDAMVISLEALPRPPRAAQRTWHPGPTVEDRRRDDRR